MHSPNFLFLRFFVLSLANPSNVSHCKCFLVLMYYQFTGKLRTFLQCLTGKPIEPFCSALLGNLYIYIEPFCSSLLENIEPFCSVYKYKGPLYCMGNLEPFCSASNLLGTQNLFAVPLLGNLEPFCSALLGNLYRTFLQCLYWETYRTFLQCLILGNLYRTFLQCLYWETQNLFAVSQ